MHLIWIGFVRAASQSTSLSNYQGGNQLCHWKGGGQRETHRHCQKCGEYETKLNEYKTKLNEYKKKINEYEKERAAAHKNEVTDILNFILKSKSLYFNSSQLCG